MAAYLFFSLQILPTITDEGPIETGSEAIMWGFFAFPILIAFFVINFVWLALILWKVYKHKDRKRLKAWLLIAIAWGGTLALDIFFHHAYSFLHRV